MGGFREWLKLIRPYGILFLGFTPVFGAICNGEFNGFRLGILLIIGLLTHIFVFVQNDYYDVDVDKKSKYVAERPLTTGRITKQHALLIFSSALILAVILTVVFVFSWRSLWLLLVSFLLMTLYNKYSKRITSMECILSTSVLTFGLFGAYTVSPSLSALAVIVSFVGFLQWLFSVGISANLKDVEYDAQLGIRTTPMLFGVKVADKKLLKTKGFLAYASGIQLLHLVAASLPFVLGFTAISINGVPLPLLCFLIVAFLILYTAWGILTSPLQKRDTMLRYEGAHEGLALLLVPLVLMNYLIDYLGTFPTILLILVVLIWPLSILRILYGKTLIPLE